MTRSFQRSIRQQDQNITTDCGIQTQSVFDGLGRPVETRQIEYGANDFIAVDTSYDALGRVYQSFNPSRINISTGVGDGLDYPTTYSYDALGRVTQVKTDDGSVTATSYLGDQTTVTDPAQRVRQSWTDALGRLVKVVEDPSGLNYQTIYTFAADDTLQSVTQGSQTRTFAYDSLARLTRATNPESGAASYTYDANGNVLTRTDGRSVVTSYTYDALNRLTGKSYSDTTPAMGFSWDAYRIGSLSQASDGYTSTLYPQYDPLGRITQSQVALNFQNYTFQYAYNLAGSLTRETYPSGRVITTSYDTANRPYAVSGTQGLQTNYVTQTGYWPHGAPYWQWYGNGIFPVWVYNSRLQPNNIYSTINNQDNQWLFWEQLGWSAPNTTTNDNGILQTAVVSEGGPSIRSQMLVFSQLFGYDMANRLTAAIDTNWVRTFHYDAYGNMSVSANGGAPLSGLTPQWQNNVDPFDPATNRLLSGGYDAAGNQAVMGSLSMWRDAENRQYQTWDSLSNVLVNYLYDSEGRRVQKTVAGGATTDYVYDALGQLAAEYTGAGAVSKEYIRLGGQLVATENAAGSPCQTCYLSYDHLGSVRLVTDQNANVVARHEYLPFGEALDGWAGRTGSGWGTFDNVNQRFTGQERDSETNLDFFQARYFGAALGRFTSPDPENAGADVTNPQSWNGYSYVANNPLNSIDPSGACDVAIYGLTMNPGESSDVTSFSAGKVAVFPYAGTNLFTGLWQVATGGGEIGAATQAIRSAISQTPAGQSVNIFAFSGGAQTLASAWGQLSSSEQGRIGNITYAIPGSLTGALFNGTLPRGNGNPTILLPSANNEIPGGAPQEPYNVRWETSCGHDVGCIIRKAANFLKAQSGTACAASKVFSQSSPKPNGPKGSATSTITYGPVGGFGWDEFDLLNLLSGFGGSTPPDDFQRRISY